MKLSPNVVKHLRKWAEGPPKYQDDEERLSYWQELTWDERREVRKWFNSVNYTLGTDLYGTKEQNAKVYELLKLTTLKLLKNHET